MSNNFKSHFVKEKNSASSPIDFKKKKTLTKQKENKKSQVHNSKINIRKKKKSSSDAEFRKTNLEVNKDFPKLHKILAQMGFGSRRSLEMAIDNGEILVNGKVAYLGQRVNIKTARVTYHNRTFSLCDSDENDGSELLEFKSRVIMYNKPLDVICTMHDPEGRPTVFADLPRLKKAKWNSVGRLDINTSGLMLFCQDGNLAAKLMHPSSEIVRKYSVRVFGRVTPEILDNLRKGVMLEDGYKAQFNEVQLKVGGTSLNQWYNVTVRSGRNRLVRKLWESQGLKVSRLIRISYGPIQLPRDLFPGQTRDLTPGQLKEIYQLFN